MKELLERIKGKLAAIMNREEKVITGQEKGKRKPFRWTTANIFWLCMAVVLFFAVVLVGIHYYKLIRDPRSAFETQTTTTATTTTTAAVTTTIAAEATPTPTPEPTPTPTLSPYERLQALADYNLMDGIVNVLVIGVDYAPERETWAGKKEWHSDVMLLLAINFNENKVDMISLPRDTYAQIPGVKGKYKLNAAINCGGGFPDGLPKVCEAAEWMLGGIPVDYYFAVTMPVVKELVDAIGGVEYDLDVSFSMAGRKYEKGRQFMNGQAVLDYLRVRKNVEDSGDLNRVNRQKKMLLALFEACQSRNLVVKFPEIIKAFSGKLFTNMSFDQTVALALFAYNVSADNIAMHSMGGKEIGDIFNWKFVITDQKKRVQLVEDVYGLEVPQEYRYGLAYATWEWAMLKSDVYLQTIEKMEEEMAEKLAKDAALATPTPSPTPTPTPAPTATPTSKTETTTTTPTTTTTAETTTTTTTSAETTTTTTATETTTTTAAETTTTTTAETTTTTAEGTEPISGSGGPKYGPEVHEKLTALQDQIKLVKELRKTYGEVDEDILKATEKKAAKWEAKWEKAARKEPKEMIKKAEELTKEYEKMKKMALELKDIVGCSVKLNWSVKLKYEINVDFR